MLKKPGDICYVELRVARSMLIFFLHRIGARFKTPVKLVNGIIVEYYKIPNLKNPTLSSKKLLKAIQV